MKAELTYDIAKPTLKVEQNAVAKMIIIKDNIYTHPTSWFITNAAGTMFKSGRVIGKEMTIPVPELEEGIYHFRAQGEVYELNMGLAI